MGRPSHWMDDSKGRVDLCQETGGAARCQSSAKKDQRLLKTADDTDDAEFSFQWSEPSTPYALDWDPFLGSKHRCIPCVLATSGRVLKFRPSMETTETVLSRILPRLGPESSRHARKGATPSSIRIPPWGWVLAIRTGPDRSDR